MKFALVLGVVLFLAAGCGGGGSEAEGTSPSVADVDVGMDLRQVMTAAGAPKRVSPGEDDGGHCPCTVWYYDSGDAEIWFDRDGLVWAVKTP